MIAQLKLKSNLCFRTYRNKIDSSRLKPFELRFQTLHGKIERKYRSLSLSILLASQMYYAWSNYTWGSFWTKLGMSPQIFANIGQVCWFGVPKRLQKNNNKVHRIVVIKKKLYAKWCAVNEGGLNYLLKHRKQLLQLMVTSENRIMKHHLTKNATHGPYITSYGIIAGLNK